MNQIVLQRKLTIPSSGKLFNRSKLVEKLNLYSQFPLTLIIAPAGYGKTSLVCDWLQYASHPVHWLSLDEQNNLPSSFWLYLCACLRHIDRDLDDKAERMLETHFIDDYCLISDLVLASLEKLTRKWNRPNRVVIVLDDFQFIDHPQILQSFNRFLDYMPSWLQVVITARKPPALMLANRCSKSTAHIISTTELIFQPQQITNFLTIKLGLELSEQQQQVLFEKTEGWPAAIQLIGLALKSGARFEDCTDTNDSLLADFLFEEVFSQLEASVQNVLKDICITEYFDLELCQLFNPSRQNAAILELLIQQGLFISKIESAPKESNSYRLHSLFRHWIIDNHSLNQETIQNNKLITLAWLTNNKSYHEALELSLELKDWQGCAELMAKLYPSLIQVTHFDHVSSVLSRIPESIIQSLPHLCLLSALINFSRYEYAKVEEYTGYIEAFFQPDNISEYYSESERISLLMGSMVLRAQIARFAGQRDKAKAITHQLESKLYSANNSLNCWVIFGKGIDCFFNDEITQSIQHNQKSLALAKEIEDGLCTIAALSWLLHALYHNGQIQQAITLAEENLAWLHRKDFLELPNTSSVYAAMAILYTENNELDSSGLLELVQLEMIDYTIADSNEIAANRPLFPELRVAFNISDPQPLAWAMPLAEDGSLYNEMALFFDEIEESGELDRLIEKYYGHIRRFDYIDTRAIHRRMLTHLPKYQAMFEQAGEKNGFDWRLLAAISYQESHWDREAISSTGVKGLMMLTLATAKQMKITDRKDPEQSISAGAAYLASIQQRLPKNISEDEDRLWMALASYNIGLGHLEDARVLTQKDGKNPNLWTDVRQYLPLLSKKKWYEQTRYGYARGGEPVRYIENIRRYYDILLQTPIADSDTTINIEGSNSANKQAAPAAL